MAIPTGFTGNLRTNEINGVLFNMIISQRVFSKNISGDSYSMVDRHREEGTLYGDTILLYSTDALYVEDFKPDTVNQLNLLAIQRAPDPYCQAIVLDQGRFIQVTTDEYWSKRAWSTENGFRDYLETTMKWLQDTKKIYNDTLFNTAIGNAANENTDAIAQSQNITTDITAITPPDGSNTMNDEAYRRLVTETVARKLDDISAEMVDVSREWNDLEFTRKLDLNDFDIIWNADPVNWMRSTGLPSLYHNDGLLKIQKENILPRHYFGKPTAVTAGQVVGTDIPSRTIAFKNRVKLGIGPWAPTQDDVKNNRDVFWPGQFCPDGYTTTGTDEYEVVDKFEDFLNNGTGTVVLCKIINKKDFPYMSGYQTQREFINDKNLSQNHYLHFMHNPITHIREYPLVTVYVSN